jgi:hypothetical protein
MIWDILLSVIGLYMYTDQLANLTTKLIDQLGIF